MLSRENLIQNLNAWRRECKIIESEMDRLVASVVAGTNEDRSTRTAQFLALIERRETADRKALPPNLAKALRSQEPPKS